MQGFLSALVWIYWAICFHLCLIAVTLSYIVTWPFDRFHIAPNYMLKYLAWMILVPIPSWSFDIHGADCAKIASPTIVISNHQSFLDIPLLYLLPWRMKWVTKKSMLRIPVLGWMIAMSGHIPIDRRSLRSVGKMNELIKPIESGIPGLIFPEGTRSATGALQPFKKGAFAIAKKYNFNVLPVVVKGGDKAMPRGSWRFYFHTRFSISVLEPIQATNFEDAECMKEAVFKKIDDALRHDS